MLKSHTFSRYSLKNYILGTDLDVYNITAGVRWDLRK